MGTDFRIVDRSVCAAFGERGSRSSAALGAVREAQASWAEAFARQLALALPKMDVGRWSELLMDWSCDAL